MNKNQILGIIASLSILGLYYQTKQSQYVLIDDQATLNQDPLFITWENWKSEYGKKYGADDGCYRFTIFKQNHQIIEKHNSLDKTPFQLGHNEYSDLTNEEFVSLYTGGSYSPVPMNIQYLIEQNSQADSKDWRSEGKISQVKNQGQCGSCWAFSAIGALEGANAIKTGKITEFSEQALVDCSNNGNQGCNGGLMDYAFSWVQQNGIPSEAAYPYVGRDQTCKKFASVFQDISFIDVPQKSPSQLKAALNVNPVSVAINASGSQFQFYKSGVLDFECSTQLNHGVLAVGYAEPDSSKEKPYWIVKNSWGTGWGEQGYVKMRRDDITGPGLCGIQMAASYPKA